MACFTKTMSEEVCMGRVRSKFENKPNLKNKKKNVGGLGATLNSNYRLCLQYQIISLVPKSRSGFFWGEKCVNEVKYLFLVSVY